MAAYTVLILVATFIGHLSGSAASDEGGWIHLFTSPPEGKAPSTPLEQAAVELLTCKPGNAKRIGKRFPMVAGWDGFKLDVMRTLVTQKFAKEPLRSMLLITGDEELVENNSWNDTWWGVCRGVGENNLGKLLMTLRSGLRQDVPK